MFEGPVRLFSILATTVVLLSFGAFAIDEARSGSESSQAGIARETLVASAEPSGYAAPTPAQERERESDNSGAREWLDDGNDVLLAPIAFVSEDNASAWMRRGVPALVALLVYGFGLGFLARYAAGRA